MPILHLIKSCSFCLILSLSPFALIGVRSDGKWESGTIGSFCMVPVAGPEGLEISESKRNPLLCVGDGSL